MKPFLIPSADCFMDFASDAHKRTTELLTKHREDVIKVAELLLEKENITRFVFPSIPPSLLRATNR